MVRRSVVSAVLLCAACGRTGLTVGAPPPDVEVPVVRDVAVPDDTLDESDVFDAGQVADVVDAVDAIDVGTDAGTDTRGGDSGYAWEAGVPVQSTASPTPFEISAAATPTSALVGLHTATDAEVIAFAPDGVELGPARAVLPIPTDDRDAWVGPPWVAWSGARGAVSRSFHAGGCAVQSLDAAGRLVGASVMSARVACEMLHGRADGGWDVLTWQPVDVPVGAGRLRLDATFAAVGSPDPLMGSGTFASDRSSLDDGTEVIVREGSGPTGPSGPDFVTIATGPGASSPPVHLAPGSGFAPNPRILGVGTEAWIAWSVPPASPGTIAIVDVMGHPTHPPFSFGRQPYSSGLGTLRGDVFLAWTESIVTSQGLQLIGLYGQSFHADATPSSPAVVLDTHRWIAKPEVVETSLGALVIYVATTWDFHPSLFALPIYCAPAP